MAVGMGCWEPKDSSTSSAGSSLGANLPAQDSSPWISHTCAKEHQMACTCICPTVNYKGRRLRFSGSSIMTKRQFEWHAVAVLRGVLEVSEHLLQLGRGRRHYLTASSASPPPPLPLLCSLALPEIAYALPLRERTKKSIQQTIVLPDQCLSR